jgi:hypothetical protein
VAKSKISERSKTDEEFAETAFADPEDLLQGYTPPEFKFNDSEWTELNKFRTFDLNPDNEELSIRQALESAVSKYVIQELSGSNSESVIRLLRELMPKLNQVNPIIVKLKKIVALIDKRKIFNGFGDYQYGSAIDESYFEHFELFDNLMNRCYEEINRPLTGRKSENVVALVKAINTLCCKYSSKGHLRQTTKGVSNNDVSFITTVFEITATRFNIKEISNDSIKSAIKTAMKELKNRPAIFIRII